MRGNWCKNPENRRHFAKKGRLYCNKCYRIKNDNTLSFMFRDVYARSLDRYLRETLSQPGWWTGTESEYASRAYTVPVKFKDK
jgi:hypothetical protein